MTENIVRISTNPNIAEKYKKKILDIVDESGDDFVEIMNDIFRDLRSRIKEARKFNREE